MNLALQEAETSEFLWVQDQPGLQSEFQASQGHTMTQKRNKIKKQTKNTKAKDNHLETLNAISWDHRILGDKK